MQVLQNRTGSARGKGPRGVVVFRAFSLVGSYLILSLWQASLVSAAPLYSISAPLGFTDTEHTRNDGYRFSEAFFLNNAGQMVGDSLRYNGGAASLGQSAWFYDGTLQRIGLTGSDFTRSDGYAFSRGFALTESGHAIGESSRFVGSDQGQSVWFFDGTTTSNIGLTDTEHTRSNGYQFSDLAMSNAVGDVVGTSDRYNGGVTPLGQSAWIYHNGSTTKIGFTGAVFTAANGAKYSAITDLNTSGQVIGFSQKPGSASTQQGAWLYDGTTTVQIGFTGPGYTLGGGGFLSGPTDLNDSGQVTGSSTRSDGGSTAWLYESGAHTTLGLFDAEHTNNAGLQSNSASQVNEAGDVMGFATRYNGGVGTRGSTVWYYNGTTTVAIGLKDAAHTSSSGGQFPLEAHLNEGGKVLGRSTRYSGASPIGNNAWLFNGTSTVLIGLTDAEHTRNDGFQTTSADLLDDAGRAAGLASRFNGSTSLGTSAWFFDGTTTRKIGLTDATYTRNDGFKRSGLFLGLDNLNALGQVVGFSDRYNGLSSAQGSTAWLYDSTLDETFPMLLDQTSTGVSSSSIAYLGDDGLVLGTYELYDNVDQDLGARAFYFRIGEGAHDLGMFVDDGLSANGWSSLAAAFRANDLGQIIGVGLPTSQTGGEMALLLTPVPEPSGIALSLVGGVAMAGVVLKRRNGRLKSHGTSRG